MKAFLFLILLMSSLSFLCASNQDEIEITINLKENVDPIALCDRLQLSKGNSIEMMQRLNIIPAVIPKERLPEIRQDKGVRSIDFSQRCSRVPPRAHDVEIQQKHPPGWGKFRILFERYPFASDGSIPRRNPPGFKESVLRNKGEGVDIFIVDSGILDTHSFFQDNDTMNSRAHLTWTAYEGDPSDKYGHGTHVAAIAAGNHPLGIAQKSTLHSIKVLDNTGNGAEIEILRGLDAILLHKMNNPSSRCSIVNMSLASENSRSINTSIEKLIENKAVVVASAGNYAADASKYSPANLDTVITVGASSKYPDAHSRNVIRDKRWGGSNFGPCVDIYAPGFCIYSADCLDNNDTSYKDGSSQAAAYVSAVSACVAANYPGAKPRQIKNFMIKYAKVGEQVEVNSPEHRHLGSLLFACPKATPELPEGLSGTSYRAQSAEDYYRGYFSNGSAALRASMSQSHSSMSSLCEELSALMSISEVSPTLSSPMLPTPRDKIRYHQGTIKPGSTKVIGHHMPSENELLRVYLNQSSDGDSNLPFYSAYLEYARQDSPNVWTRREPRLLTQNGIETYIEVEPHMLYRITVELYAGTFDYNLELEPAPIPCLEEDSTPVDLEQEAEAIEAVNRFFLEL